MTSNTNESLQRIEIGRNIANAASRLGIQVDIDHIMSQSIHMPLRNLEQILTQFTEEEARRDEERRRIERSRALEAEMRRKHRRMSILPDSNAIISSKQRDLINTERLEEYAKTRPNYDNIPNITDPITFNIITDPVRINNDIKYRVYDLETIKKLILEADKFEEPMTRKPIRSVTRNQADRDFFTELLTHHNNGMAGRMKKYKKGFRKSRKIGKSRKPRKIRKTRKY